MTKKITTSLALAAALVLIYSSPCLAGGGLLGNTIKAVGKATGIKEIEKVGEELDNAHKDLKEAVPIYKDIEEQSAGAVRGATGEIEKVASKTIKETGIGLADIEETLRSGKCGGDICDSLAKAVDDTIKEGERGLKNLEDAAHAIGKYVERELQSTGATLASVERRLREGKVVDAFWHLGIDPLRHTEDNLAKATQESSLINTVGQVAATAYGGPGGAAAYAAWYTYKETGDAELALRVGIISGATSSAFGTVGEIPSSTVGQTIKKSLLAGAIGGIAVAASGGDEAAVREGFLRSGGMILVRDGYKRVMTHELDARASEGEAFCMSTVGADCSPPDSAYIRDEDGKIQYDKAGKPLVDIRKTDPRRPHVGNWSTSTEANWNHERGAFMTGVSRIPGMNAMSFFHDHWAATWKMDAFTSRATIVPSVVLTYIGTGAPAYDLIQKTNVADLRRSDATDPSAASNGASEGNNSHADSFAAATEQENTDSAAATFLCLQGNLSRQILIDAPSEHPDYACRVIYQSEKGLSVPWFAKNEESYCRPRAVNFVARQISWGWTCSGQ